MTAPRQRLRGVTYLVTARCLERRFMLTPRPQVTAILRFVLAVAARRYGVHVHAACALSNHYHLVVTDPKAQLPLFQQFLDGLVARAINRLWGREDAFWAGSTYGAVVLATPEDVVDKVAYTLANPVAAGLVRSGGEWPGLWSAPEALGGAEQEVGRPGGLFGRRSDLPAVARLRFEVPRGFESASAFRAKVRRALARLEVKARRGRRTFLGAAAVLRRRWDERPKADEPLRKLNPQVAGRDPEVRMGLIARLKQFLVDYANALARRRRGDARAVFPRGTYQLRVQHGVACAGAG